MKFSKRKYQILYLGQSNTEYIYRLKEKKLESSTMERNLDVLVKDKLNVSQQCVLVDKKVHLYPGVHQA